MTRLAVHLNDEAPRIGAGRRHVEIVSAGHKWTTVRYKPGGPNGPTIRHKFKTPVFKTLVKEPTTNG